MRLAVAMVLFVVLSGALMPASAQAADPYEPVTANADWTPLEQEFNDVTMVLVPPGCFMMGSTVDQVDYAVTLGAKPEWLDEERPANQQCLDTPYWIDKYEGTQAQYAVFVEYASSQNWFRGDQLPAGGVTWFGARDFCALRDARLPTEAEWEYAARGPDGLVYPWGDEWDPEKVVGYRPFLEGTADVGSIPDGASWVGALDMSGNLWEWVDSVYLPYPYKYVQREDDDFRSEQVLRGGSWVETPIALRTTVRFPLDPYYPHEVGQSGVRCARDYEPPQKQETPLVDQVGPGAP